MVDKDKYISNSTKVNPACESLEAGISTLTGVLILLISVTIIGGVALRFYSIEALQSTEDIVQYRLSQNARRGLEATFSFLYSMGATTLSFSSVYVEDTSLSKTLTATYCNYFPRTDDVILPFADSLGNYTDINLSNLNSDCTTARPNSTSLLPTQLNRYNLDDGYATTSEIYSNSNKLNLTPPSSQDNNFRSVFPWVRYRSQQGIMDAQYGAV